MTTTDVVLAVCPGCGSGLPDCTVLHVDNPLWESWHRAFCSVAARDQLCENCPDTGW